MEKYLDGVFDRLSKAVYFMCKAAFAKLFNENTAVAIKFTRTAQNLVPDVLSGDKEYSQREISLCYNICNNLGAFYLDNHENFNARKFLKKSQIICEKFKTPIYELPALINSLEKMEIVEKNSICMLK